MGALSTAEGFTLYRETSPGFTAEYHRSFRSHQGPCECCLNCGVEAPPSNTKGSFGSLLCLYAVAHGIEAASGTDAGGESDSQECLRTLGCLRAGSRMQARARPARPIPAGSANIQTLTRLSWGFFLRDRAGGRVVSRVCAEGCGLALCRHPPCCPAVSLSSRDFSQRRGPPGAPRSPQDTPGMVIKINHLQADESSGFFSTLAGGQKSATPQAE
jgi:hypothetical protein